MGNDKKEFVPYVTAEDDYPQITFKAVVLGILLSAILAGANAYLGLKVGMTVSASYSGHGYFHGGTPSV